MLSTDFIWISVLSSYYIDLGEGIPLTNQHPDNNFVCRFVGNANVTEGISFLPGKWFFLDLERPFGY